MQDLTRLGGAALLGCGLLACDATDSTPSIPQSDPGELNPRGADAALPPMPLEEVRDAGFEDLFPSNWCKRAGATVGDQADAMLNIGLDYLAAQKRDCRVSGLIEGMTTEQDLEWGNYLIGYTYLMAGCSYLIPVPGGILAFGPANTYAIGLARPPLGRDDAAAVIELYLGLFGEALKLSDRQRDSVAEHLLVAAELEIDPGASGVLSRCGDAGVDGGN
jgi:hypothetical protein